MKGRVVSVNVADAKGVRKAPVDEIVLVADHGVEGDGHAGPWHRQVSLLAQESIDTMRAKGLEVGAGDFAENVTTEGVAVATLPVGTRLRLGSALLEVSPAPHTGCKKFRERFGLEALTWVNDHRDRRLRGMNCRVLEAGAVAVGDPVEVA